jgi:hypothetical protein
VDGTSVWLTLANCSGEKAYSGSISFDPQAVGLEPTGFDVKIVKSGEFVPAHRTEDGKIQWRVNMPAAGLEVVRLSPRTAAAKGLGDYETGIPEEWMDHGAGMDGGRPVVAAALRQRRRRGMGVAGHWRSGESRGGNG